MNRMNAGQVAHVARKPNDRTVYVGDPVFHLTSQNGQASATRYQRDRIVHANRHCAARQPNALWAGLPE